MKLADGFGGSNPPDATFFKELNVSITHSLQYGILHLTIDRVERRNALTAEMFAEEILNGSLKLEPVQLAVA